MAKGTLSHRERMEACLAGEAPDRVPVALWRHFPVDDQVPANLAQAVVNFQRTYDFDFVKVTSASSFCLKDWGAKDEWLGATEGTRDYTQAVIEDPEDWGKLTVLDPRAGHLGAQLECLRLIVQELGPDTPVIQTIFNPLSQAKNLVGKGNLEAQLRQASQAVHAGLETITRSTRDFIHAAKETGIAGVFYAVQHAQYGLLAPEEYETFGRKYDLQVLEAASDLWLNVLHIHGDAIMFEQLSNYPVQVVNWHDRETPPTLPEGKRLFAGAVCGGIRRHETLALGAPEEVISEARDAIQSTSGRRFVLGTGCVVPIIAPHGNILAARRAVEEYGG